MSSETEASDVGFDAWHGLTAGEVAARLGLDPLVGLAVSGAATRLDAYGPNRLPRGQKRSSFRAFIDQFRSFLVVVLVCAAVLAAIVGDVKDVVVICVVVLFNAVLGFVQEHRAESSLAALERMLVNRARVRRGGVIIEVNAEELVPGDVVLVDAGDRVPADGRWFVTVDLH